MRLMLGSAWTATAVLAAAAGIFLPGKATACDEKKSRRTVAIYGGAFDPITNAHLTAASEIVHSGCADECWIVPCGPRPDKPKLKTTAIDRYCMCEIAVNTTFSSADFPVRVSDIECFADEAFYTYDLLLACQKAQPDTSFCFVIGTDWLQPGTNIEEWTSKNWDWKEGDPPETNVIVTGRKMLEEFDFLVVVRPGYDVKGGLEGFGPRLKWLRMPENVTFIEGNLSSTEVRRRSQINGIAGSCTVDRGLFMIEGLVPPGVIAYIARKGIYRSEVEKPLACR